MNLTEKNGGLVAAGQKTMIDAIMEYFKINIYKTKSIIYSHIKFA